MSTNLHDGKDSVDNYNYLDYNNVVRDIPYHLLHYIIIDSRKSKYLKYSSCQKFFELPLDVMDILFSKASKKASSIYTTNEKYGYINYYIGDIEYILKFCFLDKEKNNIRIMDIYESNSNKERRAVVNEEYI